MCHKQQDFCVSNAQVSYIHFPSMDTDYFHFLVTVNKGVVIIGVQISSWVSVLFPLDKYPEVDLLEHMVPRVLIFE